MSEQVARLRQRVACCILTQSHSICKCFVEIMLFVGTTKGVGYGRRWLTWRLFTLCPSHHCIRCSATHTRTHIHTYTNTHTYTHTNTQTNTLTHCARTH